MGGMRSSARALRLGVAALATIGLSACNLLTGASDLDIAAGGDSSPSPAGDAGTSDSPPPTKEPTRDGGATPDSGGALSLCTAATTFCDDFDGASGLSKRGLLKLGDATIAIDSLAAVSAPSSLLITYPETPTANTVGAELTASTKVQPTIISLTFSMRIESSGDGNDTDALTIAQLTLGSTWSLKLGVRRTGDTVLEESQGPSGPASSVMDLTKEINQSSAFSTIEIQVGLQAPAVAATVKIDGKDVGQKSLSPPASRGTLGVAIGDRSVSGTKRAWKIRYDNVVLVAK